MLPTIFRRLVIAGVAAASLVACDGGGDPAMGRGPSVTAYTFTCAESSCDRCQDQASDRYSECLRLCSSPYAPSNCYSQCGSIGDSSCPYSCGENERCEKWVAVLPKPERNEAHFQACTNFMYVCAGVSVREFVDAVCDAEARLEQPRLAEEYGCDADLRCPPAAPECPASPGDGTLGTQTCQRAASCGAPCPVPSVGFPGRENFLNAKEGRLRTSLVQAARQCLAEATCENFNACNEALGYLWDLASHNYSGG